MKSKNIIIEQKTVNRTKRSSNNIENYNVMLESFILCIQREIDVGAPHSQASHSVSVVISSPSSPCDVAHVDGAFSVT